MSRTWSIAPENTKLAAWANTTPSLILNVQRQPGANVIQVANAVKRLLPTVKADMPPALDIGILSDRTATIRASVSDVEFELVLAVILVVLVIFVFLRNAPAPPSFRACRCRCRWSARSAPCTFSTTVSTISR